jgi:hypothetical protein
LIRIKHRWRAGGDNSRKWLSNGSDNPEKYFDGYEYNAMKPCSLRLLISLLLLTLFSQTLQAAVRSVHCAWAGVPPVQQQHCHANQTDAVTSQHTGHADTHAQHAAQLKASFAVHDGASSQCPPGCDCCWNACSASLLSVSQVTASSLPSTESYRALPAQLPASPVEQALKPPRAA